MYIKTFNVIRTTFFLYLLIIGIVSCQKKSEDEFILHIKVENTDHKLLYLKYGGVKDSAVIKNGLYEFRGSVNNPSEAYLYINSLCVPGDFYLENEIIDLDLKIKDSTIQGHKLTMFHIGNVSGTKTAILKDSYETFRNSNPSKEELYNKVEEIIKENPKNQYIGELFLNLLSDSTIEKEELKKLYVLIDKDFQSVATLDNIERGLFPERELMVGDQIKDFQLEDTSGNMLSTLEYRESILLVDFWASWCLPCIKQFPEVIRLNEKFNDRNFKVLGVSFDDDKTKWMKALNKVDVPWDNVIDTLTIRGEIAKDYNIIGIPYNLLIDESGTIIGKNLSVDEIEAKLKTHFY